MGFYHWSGKESSTGIADHTQGHQTSKCAHLGGRDENRGFRFRQEEHNAQDEKLIRSWNPSLHVTLITHGSDIQQQMRHLGSRIHLL